MKDKQQKGRSKPLKISKERIAKTNNPIVKEQSNISSVQNVKVFGKMNFYLMFAGIALIVIGSLLMVGKENIYGTVKITIAPILIFLGFMVEIAAILYRPKQA